MQTLIRKQKTSPSLAQLQKLDLPNEKRRRINRKIVLSLATGQARAFIKLKKLTTPEACQQVTEDFLYSPNWVTLSVEKLKEKSEELKEAVKRNCKLGQQANSGGLGSKFLKLLKMLASYVDLVRDAVLVAILIDLTGFQGFDDLTLFPNVVILILSATLVVPLFVSAVWTSAKHPLTIFEFSVWNDYNRFLQDCHPHLFNDYNRVPPGKWELVFIRSIVFCCYIFVPAILFNNKEEAKMKRQLLEEEGREEYKSKEGLVSNKVLDEQEQIEVYIDEVRKAHLIFKRNESAIEIVAQMGIQLTMLLLSRDRVA